MKESFWKKYKKDLLIIAVLAVLTGGLLIAAGGCGKKTVDWKAYNIANQEFTGMAEQYDSYYRLQAPDTQTRWKAKFDPIFDKGDRSLADWRKVLDAGGDATMQLDAFNAIKMDMINILFELSSGGKK